MGELFQLLFQGFGNVLTPAVMFASLIGCLIGILVGIIPGIGASAGIAIMLPTIYGHDPLVSMALLAGIFFGSSYGGTITAVLLNVPGTAASICTGLDGFPLAKQGRAGAAIGMGTIASTIGGTIGTILLTLMGVPLARWGLRLSEPEYFAVYAFAFMALVNISGNKFFKSMMVLFFGLLIGTIGNDGLTGYMRLTGDNIRFYDGINFVPALIGLFGFGSMLEQIVHGNENKDKTENLMFTAPLTFRNAFPTLGEVLRNSFRFVRASIIGFFVGVLPGAGGSTATFFAYEFEKNISKDKESWGKGNIDGVATAEASNSSCFAGTYVPLFALGIPGSATSALLLGALILLGLQPGPLFFQQNSELAWGVIASMYLANVILFVVTSTMIPFFIWIMRKSQNAIVTVMLTLCFLGTFCLKNSLVDLWTLVVFGVIGYVFQIRQFPAAPTVLALVLGRSMEISLRRGLIMVSGNVVTFFSRPVTLVFTILALCMFIMGLFNFFKAIKGKSGDSKQDIIEAEVKAKAD